MGAETRRDLSSRPLDNSRRGQLLLLIRDIIATGLHVYTTGVRVCILVFTLSRADSRCPGVRVLRVG